MALKILGKKYYDFTSKEGQRVQGLKLHCVQDQPSSTEGFLTELISVGFNKPIYTTVDSYPFGTLITPVYNRYGSIEDVILVSLPEGTKKAAAN